MPKRITGGALLLGAGFGEVFFPGWNGYFAEPSDISADAQRIVTAIFITGGAILIFGAPE